MNLRTLFSLIAVCGLVFSGWLAAYAFADDAKQGAKADNDGWEILFDGTSLDAFKPFKKDQFEDKCWTIDKDGTLRSRGPGPDMITRKQYSDFDLRMEWKLSKGANSGIIYRGLEEGTSAADTSAEYQIYDTEGVHAGSSGSLYALIAPNDKAKVNPIGEWNSTRIVIKDNKVEHYLNGELVVEYVWGSEEIKKTISNSKFKNMKNYMLQETGHIGFQCYKQDLWFRNIKIKDLSEKQSDE